MIMIGVGLSAPQDFKTFEIYKISNSIIRVKNDVLGTDSLAVRDSTTRPAPSIDSLHKK
jgi:hypothetical protein